MASTVRERKSSEAGMNIAAGLNRLGLEQYEQAFRENDVDAEVFPDLSSEDWIGLGVTSIGHRRKLLAALPCVRRQPIVHSQGRVGHGHLLAVTILIGPDRSTTICLPLASRPST